MNITDIIFMIGFCLLFFLFPFWCSLVMKIFCKSFSDKFITRFLAVACPLPIAVNPLLDDLVEGEETLLRIVVGNLISFLIQAWLCGLLAKGGIALMNKRNPNHSNEPTSLPPFGLDKPQGEEALF